MTDYTAVLAVAVIGLTAVCLACLVVLHRHLSGRKPARVRRVRVRGTRELQAEEIDICQN